MIYEYSTGLWIPPEILDANAIMARHGWRIHTLTPEPFTDSTGKTRHAYRVLWERTRENGTS